MYILYFRLKLVHLTQKMTMDLNTILTLYKKGDSNSSLPKKLHIHPEMVWKVLRNFNETGKACHRLSQGRKETNPD